MLWFPYLIFIKAVIYMNLKVLLLLSSLCFMVFDVALYINPADGQGSNSCSATWWTFHWPLLSASVSLSVQKGNGGDFSRVTMGIKCSNIVTCLEWCLAYRECYASIQSFWKFPVLGKDEKPVIYDGFIIRVYWILREKLHSVFMNGGLEHSLHSHRSCIIY